MSTLTDQERRAYQANIWKAYLFRFLYLLHFYSPIFVVYLRDDIGLSLTEVAVLDSLFFISILLSEVPTGAVADRFGRRISLALGAVCWFGAMITIGLVSALPVLVVAFLVWGTGTSLISGADQAILYDSAKALGVETQFERLSGRVGAIASAAILVGLFAGAPLAAGTDLSVPFIACGVASLLAAPVALSMHEPRRAVEERERYFEILQRGLGEVVRRPAVALIILYSSVLWAAVYVPPFFAQPFLREHGVDVGDLGWWQAPLQIGGMVASLLAFRVVTTLGRRATFIAMPIVVAGSYILLAGVDHLWVFVVFLVPSVVEGLKTPAVAAYLNERISSARRATVLSVQGVISGPITAGLQIGAGALADGAGLRAMFLTSGVAVGVVLMLLVAFWLRADGADATRAGESQPPTADC